MNLNNIPAGKNIPNDIYVIIEISSHSSFPVKYEINKKNNVLFVDRFIPTAMFYPYNYGYINHTLSKDGDPLDAMVISPYPLFPTSVILCRPIGALQMEDESGEDIKIMAVPHNSVCTHYDKILNIFDLPKYSLFQISHFFEQYKNLETNKWVKIKQWVDITKAKQEIMNSINRIEK